MAATVTCDQSFTFFFLVGEGIKVNMITLYSSYNIYNLKNKKKSNMKIRE